MNDYEIVPTKLQKTIQRQGSVDYHKNHRPAINGDIVRRKNEFNSSVSEY